MSKREDYWNDEYFNYWTSRVKESVDVGSMKSDIVEKDFVVPSDDIYNKIINDNNIRDARILDVGCCWGRMFNFYHSRNLDIFGVDISEKMVKEAQKLSEKFPVKLKVATAESLPFKDSFFNHIFCFGVFDATFQHKALSEFIRTLKVNGTIVVSGKNNCYLKDDKEAILAEIGARRKGEPNYFTDVVDMETQLGKLGHTIEKGYYFLRRGDFSKGLFVELRPECFYEYCLVIKKKNDGKNFTQLSYSNSI
jgi:ubiquinone/menaquinone biosynthesis C-methylase UbiE